MVNINFYFFTKLFDNNNFLQFNLEALKLRNTLLNYTINMILDHISNGNVYFSLHPCFEKAFSFLNNTNFKTLKEGKYMIDSDKCFAIVNRYKTKPVSESFAESHKKYIDIQFIAQGKEKVGTGNIRNFKNTYYSKSDDLLKHEGKLDFITLNENYFAILFPNDVHMPGIIDNEPENVLKIVIKIETEL